jgi:Zn-dependent protease with chaperone function
LRRRRGSTPASASRSDAADRDGAAGVALELFLLVLPVFTFMLEPLSSQYSRRHEFEADAFAARHASPPRSPPRS